jgi:hypothetical protein
MSKPTHDTLKTIAKAAEAAGVSRTSLQSAVKSGHVPGYLTACGMCLVLPADVTVYAAHRPARGPARAS